MSFYQSNLHKRAPSVGTIKQGKHQCKTPKQSSSFSIDLYNYKKNTDKLNLSNILNTPATTSGSNLNCSFNQATLSSAAKSKSKNTCETVTHETFYLRPTSGQSSGRVDFQKILLSTKESRKNTTLEQTKEVESGLWDSPRSGADRNQEESSVSEEQVNQENSNNLRRKSEERKGLSRMANSGPNDYGTIKRLKEMIHKLQLKDAIQRQEITKLKRINEKIYADSRALEDRVQSLERIRNNEDYPHEKIDQKQSEKKGNRFEKSQRQGRNYSFNDSSYYESDAKPQKKSGNLMQQVERITAEKLKLEETLKNLLLDRELSKISINMNEIECSPTNQNLSRKFESIPLIPISNSNFGNLEFDAQTPHTQLKEPSPMNKKMQPNLRKSPNKSLQDSMITPKRNTNHQANDKSTERKVNKTDNQSSRDNSPSQTSILNSQRSKRVSPIDLIFNSNITQSRKDQTPRILSNRNSPMARNSARKDYIPSPRLEKKPKDEQKRNNLSIDCNPRRHSGAELKAAVLNDSAITPIKALPLGKDILYREILEKNNKSYFEESRDQSGIFSEKDVNASYLNNVSPAVLDIISQYKYKQVKPSSRTSSVSNYYSKDSQGLNESYSTKLNLEQLFASNGREKENRKNSSEKGTEKSSASMISGANMFGQGVAQVKIDPQMIPKQIIGATDYKRGEKAELVSEDKTHRKNPLDELNFAQKFTGCLPINISSLSQGNINNSFQGAIEINDASLTPGVCPIILSAQPQGRQISSKRAQMALETLRAKMNKREA